MTALLLAWKSGSEPAGERLFSVVYGPLKRIAASLLRREGFGRTLQPTALVHEAFVRLVGASADFENRTRFYAFAAAVMRHVLVDHARARLARKRRHLDSPLTLVTDLPARRSEREVEILDLDRALDRLAAEFPRPARVVEMRFFAGLREREIGEVLGITERTVKRDWAFARAWLVDALEEGAREPGR